MKKKPKEPVWNTDAEFVERRFLNQNNYHSTASIVGKISRENYSIYPYCELHISDCRKTIELDIDCNSQEDLINSEFKLKQLIEVSTNMLKYLKKLKPYIKEVEKYEKLQREQKED